MMNTQWFLKSICTDTIYHINRPLFRLGRHREHDIVCSSVVISREHANFLIDTDDLFVKDLGSSNGTFVNGQRIVQRKSEQLNNSDIVSFGFPEHKNPCDEQGCFVYEVLSNIAANDIANLLKDKKVHVKKEIEDVKNGLTPDNSSDHVHVEINGSDIIDHVMEEVNVRENIKVEPIDALQPLELQNVSYSIEDNVIVITDDSQELSCSQLFPINDPYLKIKEELSEFDHVRERPPVVVESDDDDDYDILQLLMQDNPNIDSPNSDSNDLIDNIQNNVEATNGISAEINNHNDDFVSKNTYNDFCNAIGISDTNFRHQKKLDDITDGENYEKGKCNGLNGHKDTKINNTHFPTTASGAHSSKYSKPPIIEAPPLLKATRQSSKAKENKPETKRKSSSSHENVTNKKQRILYNVSNPTPSTSKTKTSIRSSTRNTLSKEEKVKIKEERKAKLKEIYIKPARDQKHSKTTSKVSNSKPCVKVSKNRGEFMLDNSSPSSSTKKRVEVISRNTRKNSNINQPETRSSKRQSDRATTTNIEPSTSNDPRLKNNTTSNHNHVSNIAVPANKQPNFETSNSVPSTREGSHIREKINNYKSIYSQPSFNNILSILNWRTQWLEEQKRCPSYPPVNKRTAVKMCKSFANHTDYCAIVVPLLMIELWHEIYEDWLSINTPAKQNQRKFSCTIGEVQITPNHYVLKCTAYTTKLQNKLRHYVRECNIVLVHVPVQTNVQDTFYPLFGFIANCEKRPLKGNDFVDEYLSKQLKPHIPESIFHFDILIKPIVDKICLNKCMDGALLPSLVSSLREFNAVYSLESSALCSRILDPTVEDFHIPMSVQPNIKAMDKLNTIQAKVVLEATALCLGDSPGIYLIQGPPGTGKTTVIKNIVKSVILDNAQKKIRLLLTAASNSAVDGLALKIIKELRALLSEDERRQIKLVRVGPVLSVHEEVKPFLLDQFSKNEVTKTLLNEHPEVRRDYNTLHATKNTLKLEYEHRKELGENVDAIKERLNAVETEYEYFAKNYLKQAKYQKAFDIAKKRVLDGSNIICTTLSSCMRLKEFKRYTSIDCCIVDEATQSKEAETLIPLMLGVNKLILVGDPQQLPAVTISQYAKELEHGQSLFQRIKRIFDDKPSNPIRMLNIQHRMHPEISYFPSNTFYKGELKNSESCTYRDELCKILPYYVFNLNLTYNQENTRNTNEKEVECVKKLLESINNIVMNKRNERQINVGVITPYNTQKEALLKKFDSCSFPSNISITVNTVDSFQGLEKDIIIVSCVRFTPNIFLGDEQRLNVALTRAKYALYIVGTYSLFKNCTLLNRLKVDAERRKLYSNISAISTNSLQKIIKRR